MKLALKRSVAIVCNTLLLIFFGSGLARLPHTSAPVWVYWLYSLSIIISMLLFVGWGVPGLRRHRWFWRLNLVWIWGWAIYFLFIFIILVIAINRLASLG